ncbi:MAG: RHS repeat-associated core domain-containing protein [Verrucomicrobiales bacterium]
MKILNPALVPHSTNLMFALPCLGAALALIFGALKPADATPSDTWLTYYGLEPWQAVLDHDGDGASADEEFAWGTDPLDMLSHPAYFLESPGLTEIHYQVGTGESFGLSELETSTDLQLWTPVAGFPPEARGLFSLPPLQDESRRFYRFSSTLLNSDGDCLLDFEERDLFHTDPLKSDTDGDGINDCDEIKKYHTDANFSSPTGRGAIRGKVVLDEDNDPATQDHPGLAGWTVFLDLDFDGEHDPFEPAAESGASGSYLISELDPGTYRVSLVPQTAWTQVFPALTPQPSPDGYPDRVAGLFDSGEGPIPFPFGRYADPLPGLRLVFPIPPVVPVEAAIVLGVLPHPPIAGPFGGWWHVDVLAIPKDSWLTVAFDGEEIMDGTGADLTIVQAQGGDGSQAELYLGSNESNLTSAGVISQSEVVAVDLATVNVPQPVRYVKLRALDSGGAYPGWDLVGFQALNYRPLSRGHYDVTVVGGETVNNINFGVTGNDRPPNVFVSTDRSDVRAGDVLTAQVNASDDLGVASATLTANGVPVTLDAQLKGFVTVTSGGLLEMSATATDTASQQASTQMTLIARNADGSLPDLSGLAARDASGAGGPSIRAASPVPGEILTTARTITGTITSATQGVGAWQIHYAPAGLVNPEALDAPDADYVLLNAGTGPVVSSSLGTLPADTLAAGAYLLRITAADLAGTTRYYGFIIGVNIDPLDIRPAITLTAPAGESTITFLTDIRGSITTRQELREWYAELAPLSRVNLQNLSDNTPGWTRIASGTAAVTNGVLATFDPTLLPNDSYVIRVSAWNKNGLGWAEPLVLHVTGNAKLGNFAVEFTDVDLPLAGIPIAIKRTYNSLNAARSGDFGYGWSLAVQDADIAETIPQTGSGFASTPFRAGTRIYLTAPDGKRIGFTFAAEPGAESFLGTAYSAKFTPDPGITWALSVPEGESAFLSLNSAGETALFFIPLPWNPDTYILTDKYGARYTYGQEDGLIEIADVHGNRVTFLDDAIAHSSGPRLDLVRDLSGRITQIIGPGGQTWRYQYNAAGDLTQVTDPGNMAATFGYAAGRPHFLEVINDPLRGPVQRTEYDEDGRVTAIIDAAGNQIEQAWDPGSFTGTFTDARGNITQLTYDARGNLTKREDPAGGITRWEYTDARFPDFETAMVDPRSNRTTYKYDSRGNLIEDVQPLTWTLYTYDENNRVTRKQYRSGGREEFEYDALGSLTHYDSQRGEWTVTWTASGLPASVLDGTGGLARIEYDGALKLPSRIINANGGVKSFAYDAYGRLTQFTDAVGNVTRTEYDACGRMVRRIDPAGSITRYTYDGFFPKLTGTVTDRAGHITRHAYDSLARLQHTIAPGGALTGYEYDADGNRTAVVDPVGNRCGFRYDAMSRLVDETDARGRKRTHTYDPAGNRIATVDRNGRTRTFTFDTNNRVKEERWLNPADNSVLRTIAFTYDNLGQLNRVTDPDGTIAPDWMTVPGGPLTSERATYAGMPERRIASGYDRAGRRVSLSAGTGTHTAVSLAYTRDLAGYLRILTSSQPLPPSAVTGNAWQLQLWRDASGRITELRRFPDQYGTTQVSQSFFHYSNSAAGLVSSIDHVIAGNQTLPDAALDFTRDPEGGISGIQEGSHALTFAYDAAAQLTGVTRDGVGIENYGYDSNGNRTSSHLHANYTTNAGNRLTQAVPWTLSYDDEGNLITKSNSLTGVVFTFTWDHRNRLTRVQRDEPGPPATSAMSDYRYDALDRRIGVTRDGVTTWTYYDGVQPIADFTGDEVTPSQLFVGGEWLDELYAVWTRGEGAFWTLTDNIGTVRRVLNLAGTEVAALGYDSFGNPLSAAGTNPDAAGRFGFAGRERDAATGLYYNRARYYDPDLGRFISVDPISFDSGEANLYRYARNNPLAYTDPMGTLSLVEWAYLEIALDTAILALELCALGESVYDLWNYIGQNIESAVEGRGAADSDGGDLLDPGLDDLAPFGCLHD